MRHSTSSAMPGLAVSPPACARCENAGGEFHETEQGNLWCYAPSGSITVCDQNGNECTYYPPFAPPPSTHAPVGGGVLDPATPDQVVLSATSPGDHQPPTTPPPPDGHGKAKTHRRGHHGKRH